MPSLWLQARYRMESDAVTKAQHIRTLYATGMSTRDIADIVGCSDSYVRVAARQRVSGLSKADRQYWASPMGKATRHRAYTKRYADPTYRQRVADYNRMSYQRRKLADGASA